MTKDKILIVGTGAIGGFYGSLLAKTGAEVSVICRSDYPVVCTQGYQINSREFGRWHFKPAQIIKQASAYQGQADYLILCSKITQNIDRVALIKDAVSANTTIVFIQNGVETEQELVNAFPENEIVSALAFICSNRIKPGVIDHLAYGKLTLGNLPSGVSSKTQHLINLFNQTGIECIGMEDIITGRWIKCVWNAPFNPLSVISGGLSTLEILQNQETFVREIMQEVCAIASACGHPLPETVIDTNIANTYAMPPYKTSMLLDYKRRQPMETEVILGNAVRAAEREYVNCPILKSIYTVMKLIEFKIHTDHKADF